jgi:GntR family transcriptional regulator
MIDISGQATKHGAVASSLREEIERGDWKAGERIPSEQIIAKRFGVAYMTARQAVASLVAEGILERVARKGTFVSGAAQPASSAAKTSTVMLIQGRPHEKLPALIESFKLGAEEMGLEVSVFSPSNS